MHYKVIDHIVLIAIITCVSILLLTYPVSPIVGSFLYFVPPSAYLIFKTPKTLKTAMLPALIFGLPFAIVFEYLNEVGNSWIFPLKSQFVFPLFFFGIVPLDVIVWYILWVFTIICYYEYLIDQTSIPKPVLRRVYKLLVVAFLALGFIGIAEYALQTSIVIPYAYTITGLVAFIPVYILYRRKPHMFPKLALTIPFLGLFFLTMEMVALSVGYWKFVGGSILTFTIVGHCIPIEEVVFWIIASPLVISSYHELILED